MKNNLLITFIALALTVSACNQPMQSATENKPTAGNIAKNSADSSPSKTTENKTNTAAKANSKEKVSLDEPEIPDLDSLCTDDEQILLNWSTFKDGKLASLCGSKDFGKDTGYIQYRFGRPGKIELEFPKNKKDTQEVFDYSNLTRPRLNRTLVGFNTDRRYLLTYESDGADKATYKIIVGGSDRTKPDTEIECTEMVPAKYDVLGDALPNFQQYE